MANGYSGAIASTASNSCRAASRSPSSNHPRARIKRLAPTHSGVHTAAEGMRIAESPPVVDLKLMRDPQSKLRPYPVRMLPSDALGKYADFYDSIARERGRGFREIEQATIRTFDTPAMASKNRAAGDPRVLSLFTAWGMWHVWGRHSYVISPLLSELLAATSLKDVPSDVLSAPHPGIWVQTEFHPAGSPEPFTGFFLSTRQRP